MLSNKIIDFLKSKNWWFEDITEKYSDVLLDLKIPLDSDFAQFFLHAEDGPTFLSRSIEMYQVCWFMINSSDLKLLMENIWNNKQGVSLPNSFIPISAPVDNKFLFYNIETEKVYDVSQSEFHKVSNNESEPTWSSFNDFLIWYFRLE
jgi:hypothetical protein